MSPAIRLVYSGAPERNQPMMKLLLTLAFLFGVASSAVASPTPAELINTAASTLLESKGVRYDIIVSPTEDLRDSEFVIRASVLAQLNPEGGVAAFRSDARISGKDIPRNARFVLTVSRDAAQLLSYADKAETRLEIDTLDESPEAAYAALAVQWIEIFADPALTDNLRDDPRLTVSGPVRIGRDECDVIHGTTDGATLDIYIARRSGLPVRMDVSRDDGTQRVMRINKLRTNASVPDSTFKIKPAPRGFTTTSPSGDSAGKGSPDDPEIVVGPEIGNTAPPWALLDASGDRHTLADNKGKLVLLDFWATWCGPCKAAMPGLQRMQREYGRKGLNIIGVNVSEKNPQDAVDYMRSHGFTYQLLLNGDDLKEPYAVTGFPTFFLIGRDGTILYSGTGYSLAGEHRLENSIRSALGIPDISFNFDDVTDDNFDDIEDWDG